MASLFEEIAGTYTLGADGMYYPDLELPEEGPVVRHAQQNASYLPLGA